MPLLLQSPFVVWLQLLLLLCQLGCLLPLHLPVYVKAYAAGSVGFIIIFIIRARTAPTAPAAV
jgi:hypothetical protein